jgi:hypothetical protein
MSQVRALPRQPPEEEEEMMADRTKMRGVVVDVVKLRKLLAAVEKEKAKIAASRDRLRDLVSDIEDIVQSADDALDSFNYGVDRLSEYL